MLALLVAAVLETFAGSGPIAEQIDVTVTNLDLVVTDARGKHVSGLLPTEFEIRQGSQVRPITHFAEISAPSDRATQSPRAFLFLLDSTSSSTRSRTSATEALQAFVRQNLRPTDRAAVATLQPSLRLKLGWSNDMSAVAAAIAEAAGQISSPSDARQRLAERQINELLEYARTAPDRVPVSFDEAAQAVRTYAASAMHDERIRIAAINSAVALFGPAGHKRVVILVGEGLAVNPGEDLFSHLNTVQLEIESGQGPQRMRGSARGASPLTESSRYSVSDELRALMSASARAGVMLYTLDPAHHEKTGGTVQQTAPADDQAAFAATAGKRSGYVQLAEATGARSFFGVPPAMALQQVADDLNSYYSVGFRAGDGAGDIRVRSRSGLRVRVARTPQAAIAPSMEQLVLLHHFVEPESNDLKIAVNLGAVTIDGDRRKVPVRVMIPVGSLALQQEGVEWVGGFAVYVSSGNETGDATSVNRQEHRFRWSAEQLRAASGKSLTFALDVAVPAGLDRVSVGVGDLRSGRRGFQRVTIRN